MNPIKLGIIAFAFAFGGVLLGLWLPQRLAQAPSRRAIEAFYQEQGIGLIATMTALLLGLVTASAKSSFDAVNDAVKESAMQVLALDRVLARYGPETAEIRSQLKNAIGERIDMIWPSDSSRPVTLDPTTAGLASRVESLTDAIRSLKPRDDLQRALQTRAVDLAERMLQARWLAVSSTRIFRAHSFPSGAAVLDHRDLRQLRNVRAAQWHSDGRPVRLLAVDLRCPIPATGDEWAVRRLDPSLT